MIEKEDELNEVIEPEINEAEANSDEEKHLDEREILDALLRRNNISYTNKNYSIDWLISRLGNKKFSMPKYQRKYVWTDTQVIALVVSILKKLPIPKLYGYYTENIDEDQTTLVIDGQQRLTSLFMYYWGIFPKKEKNRINYGEHLKDIAALCDHYYKTNDKETKRKLEKNYQLDVEHPFIYKATEVGNVQREINLSYRHPDTILNEQEKFRFMDRELDFLIVEGNDYSDAVELFRLYNGSGTPLESQEIRNGIYQNIKLYQLINQYSDNIIENKKIETNWYRFKGEVENKKEIKRLFQFLAFFFIFNYERDGSNFIKTESPIKDLLKLNYSGENFESIKTEKAYQNYEKKYRRKGTLENLINCYSDFVAKNGKNESYMNEEFQSIKNFFDLQFEKRPDNAKLNINNLIMIFLILKENNLLNERNLIIPSEAIYASSKYSMSTEGFFERLYRINRILKEKGVF